MKQKKKIDATSVYFYYIEYNIYQIIITTMSSNITIPSRATIVNYRTMTSDKKDLAVSGNKNAQYEWMVEEVNEFYEAVHLNNKEEIRDEAMGLIRTVQQFSGSKRVVALWEKVRKDVAMVFPTSAVFNKTFTKWHAKKLAKKQALGVTADDLIKVSGIRWG